MQVCSTADEDLLVEQMSIKDMMWRKQQFRGPLIRQWQGQSYTTGQSELCRDDGYENHQALIYPVLT